MMCPSNVEDPFVPMGLNAICSPPSPDNFFDYDVQHFYTMDQQRITIAGLVGSQELADQYVQVSLSYELKLLCKNLYHRLHCNFISQITL